jgi:hypothetical protein
MANASKAPTGKPFGVAVNVIEGVTGSSSKKPTQI